MAYLLFLIFMVFLAKPITGWFNDRSEDRAFEKREKKMREAERLVSTEYPRNPLEAIY